LLYVATAHYGSPRWIEIQVDHLRRHISVEFQTWASIEGIDPAFASHFDRTVEQLGSHSGKLNHLAMEILGQADDDDLLMFLDGDAFPIADPMPTIETALSQAALLAVRRAENVDQPQPHPCFCVTTVRTWRSLPGDWSSGPIWPGGRGWDVTDVGSLLMRALELAGLRWVELLRSNKHDLDPLYFAVYGDLVYHHGAGFRTEKVSGAHRRAVLGQTSRRPAPGLLARAMRRGGQERWEVRARKQLAERSEEFFERIVQGEDWLSELI
jgi:hypothetical protein